MNRLSKCRATSANACVKTPTISSSTARITPSELTSGAADVLELLGEKPVPFFDCGELLEREGVHRTHQPELPIELTHPRLGRNARRQLRAGRRHGVVRFALEIAPQRLHSRLQPKPRLGAFQLDPLQELARAHEIALGGGALVAQLAQSFDGAGDGELPFPALGSQAVTHYRQLDLQAYQLACDPRESQLGGFEGLSAGGGVRAGRVEADEAPLDLVPARREQRHAFFETCGAHFELRLQTGEGAGTVVEHLAGLCGLLRNGEGPQLGPLG